MSEYRPNGPFVRSVCLESAICNFWCGLYAVSSLRVRYVGRIGTVRRSLLVNSTLVMKFALSRISYTLQLYESISRQNLEQHPSVFAEESGFLITKFTHAKQLFCPPPRVSISSETKRWNITDLKVDWTWQHHYLKQMCLSWLWNT